MSRPFPSQSETVEIDRRGTPQESLQHYRSLVRHYLHHKPLLEDIHKGYFEGRCESCNWVGRVGRRVPKCSQCGSDQIVPV